MKAFWNKVQQFLRDEEGVTAIEYALIAALIAVVITAAVPPWWVTKFKIRSRRLAPPSKVLAANHARPATLLQERSGLL